MVLWHWYLVLKVKYLMDINKAEIKQRPIDRYSLLKNPHLKVLLSKFHWKYRKGRRAKPIGRYEI